MKAQKSAPRSCCRCPWQSFSLSARIAGSCRCIKFCRGGGQTDCDVRARATTSMPWSMANESLALDYLPARDALSLIIAEGHLYRAAAADLRGARRLLAATAAGLDRRLAACRKPPRAMRCGRLSICHLLRHPGCGGVRAGLGVRYAPCRCRCGAAGLVHLHRALGRRARRRLSGARCWPPWS